ncbi:MAG: helix-turn-helix domain-containing protein [Solirubrobacteraceae bacterium]
MAIFKLVSSSDPKLLTATQAAAALGASSQSIRNWIRAGRLRAVRVGNRFLVPRSEVDRMLGDLASVVGEGPWDVEAENGPVRLRRVGQRDTAGDGADDLLGG